MTDEPIIAQLYTRQECSLCREMKSMLDRVGEAYALTVREIDIVADPGLEARFAEEVPVLYLDGRKAFKYRVTEAALHRKLLLLRWQRRLFGAPRREAER